MIDFLILKEGPLYVPFDQGLQLRKRQQPKGDQQVEEDSFWSAAALLWNENSAFRYATIAYAGHNWELYALWNWFKAFALDSGIGDSLAETAGLENPLRGASLAAFIVVGVGFIGE